MNKVGIKIFVNALTIFRMIFTFAMPFLIDRVSHITFLIVIGILFFTDCLDGFISRKCGAQTLFGSIMDTVADKVLSIVLIFCISGRLPVLYVILIGEIVIAVINLVGAINGATTIAVMVGKAKMWALAIATIVGYIHYFELCSKAFVNLFGIIVILMQIFVIIEYASKVGKVKEIRKNRVKFKRGKELSYVLFDTEYYLKTVNTPLLEKLTI